MGQFSDDGQWWWDGQGWIATADVVIPDLGVPQPSASDQKKLADAGNVAQAVTLATQPNVFAFGVGLAFLSAQNRALRDLRQWTLEQLGATTAYLLGATEPMVAGETSLEGQSAGFGFFYSSAFRRDLAIAVTGGHVLLVTFDKPAGQPRRIAMAAQSRDVVVESPKPMLSTRRTIIVRRGSQSWLVQGMPRVMQPGPVVAAWRAALAATTNAPQTR